MDDDYRQRQMDFILKQQAVFSSEMIELKQSIAELRQSIAELREDQAELREIQMQQAENINILAGAVNSIATEMHNIATEMHSIVTEMREGFNNLIVANEVTRKLSEDVARLAIQTSQRVTGLEHRVDEIESRQQ